MANAPKDYNKYLEPFAGSAVLFFSLKAKRAVLSDLNKDLINFYLTLRDQPKILFMAFSAFERERSVYLNIRREFCNEKDDFLRAVQFMYLNRNCFNGLFRTNKQGHFNVPYAEKARANYPSEQDFLRASNAIKKTILLSSDFRTVLEAHVERDDFIYLDPPYVKSEGRIFSEYVKTTL